jgi:hypothetical protein
VRSARRRLAATLALASDLAYYHYDGVFSRFSGDAAIATSARALLLSATVDVQVCLAGNHSFS